MIAKLHIQTTIRAGVTILKNVYCTTPLKVANITEDKKAKELQLMLMSSSPGILDGDRYQVKIELEQGSHLQLHTQSYQRLFNMKQGASQVFNIHLAAGCSFVYLPHPTVPHTASSFAATNKIYLSDNCRLVFGEILTCGRKHNGEVFLFSTYHNLTEIFLNDQIILKENLLVQPAESDTNAIGQMEGFTHQATLVYLQAQATPNSLNHHIHQLLEPEKGIIFGISETPEAGLLVKILGQGAEQLHDCLKKITSLLNAIDTLKPTLYAE